MTGGGSTFWWFGKPPGEVGRRKSKAEQSNGAVFVILWLFVLSLKVELFPEGPLQLGDRQGEGEGAIRLRPDDPGFKMTRGGKRYDKIITKKLNFR